MNARTIGSMSRRAFVSAAASACVCLPRMARSAAASGRLRPTARDLYGPHPHAEISPLGSRFRHCIHAYPGIDPYDRAGRRLLYAGFESPLHASIVVRDLQSGVEHEVATTNSADFHTAAWQRWVLDDTRVMFERRDRQGAREICWAPAEGDGAPEPLTYLSGYSIRHTLRRGTIAYGQGTDSRTGHAQVVRVDLARRTCDVVCDVREALAQLPAGLAVPGADYHFSHPVPDDAEQWMFVKLMAQVPGAGGSRYVAFFTRHLVSGKLICHGGAISGHPIWDPATGRIFNIQKPRAEAPSPTRELVLMDPATTAITAFVDDLIEGPGHPAPSPDGR
jgi:hypothetical protein